MSACASHTVISASEDAAKLRARLEETAEELESARDALTNASEAGNPGSSADAVGEDEAGGDADAADLESEVKHAWQRTCGPSLFLTAS